MLKNPVLISLQLILLSCASPSKEGVSRKEEVDLNATAAVSGFSEISCPEGIEIQDLFIDEHSFDQALGTEISFHLQVSEGIYREIAKKGYQGIFVNIKEIKGEEVLFSAIEEEKKNYNTRVHASEGLFMGGPGEKFIDFNVPYRKLLLPEGKHELNVSIEILPVRFNPDSASGFPELLYISEKPLGSAGSRVSIEAPKLYHADLTIFPFKMDKKKKDPSRFDFRMSGSGYPDLFCELKVGGETVYISRVEKNSVSYPYTVNTGRFALTEKDRLLIRVVDHDKGPFNKMDLVDSWEGNLKLLKEGKKKKLEMSILKDFSVQLSVK